MICQGCHIEAPTTYIEFHYNIGLLILRTQKSLKGSFCKTCIHKTFWEFTLINLLAGWWGFISFLVTPFFIVHNIMQFLGARSLAPVPLDARPPQLDERALQWLAPREQEIRSRLQNGEPMDDLTSDISTRAGVTPGQVQLYIATLVNSLSDDDATVAPLATAHAIGGPKNTWTCSVCGDYVRHDASFCKHCKASFVTLADVPTGAFYDPRAPAHPIAGQRGSWTCSACGGYVRQDAQFCKHCRLSFIVSPGSASDNSSHE